MSNLGHVRKWFGAEWLSGTAARIFFVLTLALLPLACVALFSTLRSIGTMEREKQQLLLAATEQNARKLQSDILSARTASMLTVNVLAGGQNVGNICARMETFLRGSIGAGDVEYAVFDRTGRAICAPSPPAIIRVDDVRDMTSGEDARIVSDRHGLLLRTRSNDGTVIGVAFWSRDAVAHLTEPNARKGANPSLILTQGNDRLTVFGDHSTHPNRLNKATVPVGQTKLFMTLAVGEETPSITQKLAVFLPLLMWAAAAIVGWIVVRWLLIQPLLALRRVVADYQPGQIIYPPQRLRSASSEIAELGEAFHAMSIDVSEHEGEMQSALERQTKLTREVHHRVKNNLQIISSLISLHSRSEDDPQSRKAFASIQRRVDALAVVQRNHYAELEENRGVSAPPLISEVAASMRASAPGGKDRQLVLEVDSDQLWLHQDVAAPVAFLIAELADLAITFEQAATIRIALVADPDRVNGATLRISSSLFTGASLKATERFQLYERVLTGLSRQLRAPLTHDPETGEFQIALDTLP
ncbi:sensor histidine kinase [Sphingobium subterraneum]|uniref:histidine kinase n=1 Tax=Sphingobium subterraneum TaxID=627688 RepID=A0A841J967_9SPHN|nr:sensor histidine kinase [Sphingobium subterraneum]MBB6125088.1 two-component sensor histidine kinase [Sphingobium subterraneum]